MSRRKAFALSPLFCQMLVWPRCKIIWPPQCASSPRAAGRQWRGWQKNGVLWWRIRARRCVHEYFDNWKSVCFAELIPFYYICLCFFLSWGQSVFNFSKGQPDKNGFKSFPAPCVSTAIQQNSNPLQFSQLIRCDYFGHLCVSMFAHYYFVFLTRATSDHRQETGRPKSLWRGSNLSRVWAVETQRRC